VTNLGVIGTGHLATYFVTALRRGGYDGRVVVTPRNADRAAALERDAGCEIAGSSQEVVMAADVVLLSVRPQHASAALQGLVWSADQSVLSAMAGVSLERVEALVPGAGDVHLIMPLSHIASVRAAIPLYPAAPQLMGLLGAAGDVVALDGERAYDAAQLAACASGWVYELADVLADELVRHGLHPEAARALALGNIAGPASDALRRPDERLAAITASIATDGTYTKLGLDLLRERGFDAPWREAIDAIAARMGRG
jgi:pyrroline-5-carboxylate reductase